VLKNYEMSRAVVTTTSPRGTLTRLSAAVLVDGRYETTTATDGAVTRAFMPLDDEVLTRIEGLVKGAIGFDATRGDAITVENIQFYEPDETAEQSLSSFTWQEIALLISQAGTPVFIILFFMIFVWPVVKFITRPHEAEVNLERLLPSGLEDLQKELTAERTRADIPDLDPVIDLSQLEELIAENASAVRENPGQAALLIRYWLNEGRL
jgi:flagellar M-ring protein FliF